MANVQILYGDLYLLKGNENDPDDKKRPVLIVSRDTLNGGNSVLAIPFYSQQLEKRRNQPWCDFFTKEEGGLSKDCVAKTDELTTLDKTELDLVRGKIGKFKPPQMERVLNAVKYTLRITT